MQIQQFTAMKFNLLWNKYLHIQRYTYKWKVVSVDSKQLKIYNLNQNIAVCWLDTSLEK